MLNATAAFVRWSPPPPQHHNGIILGYKVPSENRITPYNSVIVETYTNCPFESGTVIVRKLIRYCDSSLEVLLQHVGYSGL